MNASHRPEIFVSATSADLRSCRQLIKEALLTLGCVPVEQTNFPPDARSVREMLQARIAVCDAVIHLAGDVYGAEPRERTEPRRSYTQLEYEIARELKKPVYVFICGEGFPYDEHQPEDEERRRLQLEHRARLKSGDHLYAPVNSHEELDKRIHALQTRVEELGKELKRSRAWLGRGLVVGLMLALLLGGGLWWLNQRTTNSEVRIAQVETELDRQRRAIKAVAGAYTQQLAQLAELKLTDAQLFERAVASVSEREGIPVAELQTGINLFVASVRGDPDADFMDRALADFADQNFAAAADNAGQAADQARAKRLAAEKLAKRSTEESQAAGKLEREARNLQGQSFYSEKRYGQATQAFEAAIEVTPRSEFSENWAELQSWSSMALSQWASVSTGADIVARRSQAIVSFRAVLDVYTRAAFPQDWARTQNNLAIALSQQARSEEGAQRTRLLSDAVFACQAALEVRTRAAFPQDWASTQNSLAQCLRAQALAAEGAERTRLLTESIAACRAALEVYTREAFPLKWARSQNNFAIALNDQALSSEGAARAQALADAITAFRDILAVYTRVALPQDWARTQNNLANALRAQALAEEGPERAKLLSEAIAAYRAVIEIYTRESLPQDWAMTQYNLGIALRDQALALDQPMRMQLLAEAIVANRAALEVYTREALPQNWAMTQCNLAVALRAQDSIADGPERAKLIAEALVAMRSFLEVYTSNAAPEIYAARVQWIADAEMELQEMQRQSGREVKQE